MTIVATPEKGADILGGKRKNDNDMDHEIQGVDAKGGVRDCCQVYQMELPQYEIDNIYVSEGMRGEDYFKETEKIFQIFIDNQKKIRPNDLKKKKLLHILSILKSDQQLGIINYAKVAGETKIPNTTEHPRKQTDQENFLELRKFVNKYKEKLAILSAFR